MIKYFEQLSLKSATLALFITLAIFLCISERIHKPEVGPFAYIAIIGEVISPDPDSNKLIGVDTTGRFKAIKNLGYTYFPKVTKTESGFAVPNRKSITIFNSSLHQINTLPLHKTDGGTLSNATNSTDGTFSSFIFKESSATALDRNVIIVTRGKSLTEIENDNYAS